MKEIIPVYYTTCRKCCNVARFVRVAKDRYQCDKCLVIMNDKDQYHELSPREPLP